MVIAALPCKPKLELFCGRLDHCGNFFNVRPHLLVFFFLESAGELPVRTIVKYICIVNIQTGTNS